MTSASLFDLKWWPRASRPRAVVGVVVDLAVEDQPERVVLVGHRLVAGGEVDDAETAEPEADGVVRGDVEAVGVGAAVGDGGGHGAQLALVDARAVRAERDRAADATHTLFAASGAPRLRGGPVRLRGFDKTLL